MLAEHHDRLTVGKAVECKFIVALDLTVVQPVKRCSSPALA